MKQRVWRTRKDRVKQRYWVGQKVRPKLKRKFQTRRIEDAEVLTLYHGTDSKTAGKIFQEGLKPAKETDNLNMPLSGRGWRDEGQTVSLTSKPTSAVFYAEAAARKTKSEPVILKIKIPSKDIMDKQLEMAYPGQDELNVKYVAPNSISLFKQGKKDTDTFFKQRIDRDWKGSKDKAEWDKYRKMDAEENFQEMFK